MGMSIQVNDFQWEPGKNDAEYIKLLESSRDEWQKIAQKAITKLKTFSMACEPISPIKHYVPDGKRESAAWQCGSCLIDIGYGVNYCYNCGKKVKWE